MKEDNPDQINIICAGGSLA